MRRAQLAAACVAGAVAFGACGSGERRGASGVSTAKGVVGSYYLVNVFRPDHGFVDSTDGAIHCGPPGTGADRCGPTQFGWTVTVTLNATPQSGYGFQAWAGDCNTAGACVLNTTANGADKFVLAIFQPAGQVGHPNFTSPALHGPAYLDLLGNVSGALNCATATCHGTALQGAGIAPNCFTCHQQAGWTSWQTSCSFCHGARTPEAKAGYAVGDHPGWSAPPDAISQRLDGKAVPARTGAHQAHLAGQSSAAVVLSAPFRCETCHAVPTALSHVRGATARADVALAPAGQGSLPADLGTYDSTAGTCATYCHGANGSPAWAAAPIACGGCHGVPPPRPHPAVGGATAVCASCHPSTVKPDGTIDGSATGTHVNGRVDVVGGGACDACHGFPPLSGAHHAHDGLTTTGTFPSGYGDTRVLQDRVPGATPATAPPVYAFGCGNCHPFDASKHMSGTVDLELYAASAPAGSPKRLSSPGAAYDRASQTCSGAYCHSSGQAAPTFATTPGWTSGAKLGCAGCHGNPPRYATGGPGTATANSHLDLADDGYEAGHFLGLAGPWHSSQHGRSDVGVDASPITCQTCHADTTDPASAGPSGFYWLDTSGSYQLPGGDASRVGTGWYDRLRCATCHGGGNAAAPLATGKVLPLRHVNGARDVTLDARRSVGDLPWLPAAPNRPAAPYWMTNASPVPPWPSSVIWSGSTVSFDLAGASYDPGTKTCSNVACHLRETPAWGQRLGPSRCTACHPMKF